MIVDNSYVIFLDIICAFIVHIFLLSPPPMFFSGNPILHNVFSLFQQSSDLDNAA